VSRKRPERFFKMKIVIHPNGIWFHESDQIFTELCTNSMVTQWRELAEAFSHQPTSLWYTDDGAIHHNGAAKGYLYTIDEPVEIDKDIIQHPRTTMDQNAEFLTQRTLRVKLLCEL